MKTFVGIDPGSSSGCIVVLTMDACGEIENIETIEFDKNTTHEWFNKLMMYVAKPAFAVLEKVHGMPGMSTVAVSTFMKNVGHIEMALIALEIPFKEVTPQAWMKHYGMKKDKDESKTEWKRRLREMLQRLMPEFRVTNNNADAMLIALYAKDTHK